MLKLEEMVCSLENAKKLKELGVEQISFFHWTKFCDYPYKCGYLPEIRDMPSDCSAFTAEEILNILSAHIRILLQISKDADSPLIHVYYQPEHGTDNSYGFTGTNLADLLAKVLIAQINEGEYKPINPD